MLGEGTKFPEYLEFFCLLIAHQCNLHERLRGFIFAVLDELERRTADRESSRGGGGGGGENEMNFKNSRSRFNFKGKKGACTIKISSWAVALSCIRYKYSIEK